MDKMKKTTSRKGPGKGGAVVVKAGGPGKVAGRVTPKMSGTRFMKGGKPC